jgi:hypothetical protein
VQKLKSSGDERSAAAVRVIVDEEVQHVSIGLRWFKWWCERRAIESPQREFHAQVRRFCPDLLPGPFNAAARALASMDGEWYLPVSRPLPPTARKAQRPGAVGVGAAAGPTRSVSTLADSAATPRRWRRSGPMVGRWPPLPPPGAAVRSRGVADVAASRAGGHCGGGPVVLFVFSVWPEPDASAAGVRCVWLARMARWHLGAAEVHAASPARMRYDDAAWASDGRVDARALLSADSLTHTPPDGDAFAQLLQRVRPDVVVFERLSVEEMFGWQVAQTCPRAVRVLDTQDVHFMRHARAAVVAAGGGVADAMAVVVPPANSFIVDDWLAGGAAPSHTDVRADVAVAPLSLGRGVGVTVSDDVLQSLQEHMFRELASIMRYDVTMCVSPAEMQLLQREYSVPAHKLLLAPLFYDFEEPQPPLVGFDDRKHFCMIGATA